MKTTLSTLSVLILTAISFAQSASFCLTATDVYGGGPTTTSTYTVPAGAEVINYYIFCDTDDMHRAKITLYVDDDIFVWEYITGSGCSTDSYYYPTGQGHVLYFTIECIDIVGSYSPWGSVSVKIYTPSNHKCATSCEGS
ncbi:hypothetical protein KKC97_06240 [bacterium]|nr:hypothetical protein [bacterium]MBU1637251.1 hypothetical protein [bacterium]MBU1920268.1 hypothetical protein [bacterium]